MRLICGVRGNKKNIIINAACLVNMRRDNDWNPPWTQTATQMTERWCLMNGNDALLLSAMQRDMFCRVKQCRSRKVMSRKRRQINLDWCHRAKWTQLSSKWNFHRFTVKRSDSGWERGPGGGSEWDYLDAEIAKRGKKRLCWDYSWGPARKKKK